VTDPAAPAAEPGPKPAPERPGTEPAGEPERLGPLVLQRYRKADGRQLILYSRPPDRS
jgi:hypothetical protein